MERLPMRRVREILRLRWQLQLSVRQTARSLGVGRSVVSKTTSRADKAGLSWQSACELDDDALQRRLYGMTDKGGGGRPEPDPLYLDSELRRKGVTLELLHLEYLEAHPAGYQYTAFCDRYRKWRKQRGLSMRQAHKAGERTFVDYSGAKPHYIDPQSGKRVDCDLFAGVLGASSLTFVEVSRSQQLADWIGSHVRMFEYFGGSTRETVPDQLRSAVKDPHWAEPTINRSYEELARHYGTSVVPARPGKPRDKAKAEVAVQVAQRWILARLRNETFFSFEALQARVAKLREQLNDRPMKSYGHQSRRQLFERLEREALHPLPQRPFVYAEWSRAKVHADYHVQVHQHYYSVPYALVGEVVDVRLTRGQVELLHKHRVIAVHRRSDQPFQHTTLPAHMPPNHKAWLEKDPQHLLDWAGSVGPMTETLMERILTQRAFTQGFRSALGLRRIGIKYGAERTEAACEKALSFGATSYRPVERMLKLGREGRSQSASAPRRVAHDNVRGPEHFN
ncbi:IS21 family transposase [Ralstonia sp.]|uniref:IS21 family transposase n=1 Tax=Ralstonia sp. TaxID=54061 RepID=UPI00397AFDBC